MTACPSDNAGVPSWGSYSYAFGPLVAVGVLAVLVLLLRWAFRRGGSVVAAPAKPGTPLEYGMLVPVAEPRDREEAQRLAQRLREVGITASVADTTEGLRLMVWPADYRVAADALASRQE